MQFSTVEDQEGDWRFKMVKATRGSQTQLGTLLLAIINKSRPKPSYGDQGYITSDGYLLADFVDKRGEYHPAAFIAPIKTVVDAFRAAADEAKLDGDEVIALFTEFRRWIGSDDRPGPENMAFDHL